MDNKDAINFFSNLLRSKINEKTGWGSKELDKLIDTCTIKTWEEIHNQSKN